MKEQVKFQNGVNASIDKWSMLSARRKKRLMIRSATVVGAVVLVWRVDHCTKNLISCRLRVWTICLCYQDHKRLQYIDFTCWKAEICIIGIFVVQQNLESIILKSEWYENLCNNVVCLTFFRYINDDLCGSKYFILWPKRQKVRNIIMYSIM